MKKLIIRGLHVVRDSVGFVYTEAKLADFNS